MEDIFQPNITKDPFKTKSLIAFWMGVISVLLLVLLMFISMIVGGSGSFEEGYERGRSMGMVWSIYVVGSMFLSFILSIASIIVGGIAAKKENQKYMSFAITGIVLGSIGLSLFLCCAALAVLGIIAASSKGL